MPILRRGREPGLPAALGQPAMNAPHCFRVGHVAWTVVLTVACTDWDEGAGGGQVVWHAVQAQTQQTNADAGTSETGLPHDVFVAWDTWKPPPPDVVIDASKPDSAVADTADVADAEDTVSPIDDSRAPVDIVFRDPGAALDVGLDAAVPDGAVIDAGTVAVDAVMDQVAPELPPADLVPIEAGFVDASTPDAALPDTSLTDTPVPKPADAAVPDAPPPDTAVSEVTVPDAAPDWQGFDLTFPADAEVFAGVPGDCLSMYLFQSEVCAQGLTNACIDQVQGVGSLWAKALYQPLAECEKAVCVPKCQGLSGNQCLESCIGKYCATQFLSCVGNAKSGNQSCPATFECAGKYPEKLQSIAIFCYSNATPTAQKHFSSLIGCTAKPQTDSCTALLAACYGDGTGSKNCAQTFQCMTSCKDNQACSSACLGQASPQAIVYLDAFLDCYYTVCAPKCEGKKGENCVNPCLVNECGDTFAKCMSN